MIVLLLVLITIAILLYVAVPLVREPYWQFVNLRRLKEIYEEKKTGLWAITDIDNEYEMGKLSEEDYKLLREQFKSEILPVLKRERELTGMERIDGKDGDRYAEKIREEALSEVIRIWGRRFP
jgi:hypothetical protein